MPGKPVEAEQYRSEWLTRKRSIDNRLEAAGWRVVPFNPNKSLKSYGGCAVEESPTDNGPADYALCLDGQVVSIVEAKKLTLGPQNALVVPIREQQEAAVRTVEVLFTMVEKVEARVAAATKCADKLTQAILAKAFRGELVTTEAELAHREGRDYEPASVLVDRIRVSRQAEAERPRVSRRSGRRTVTGKARGTSPTPKT
jgi:hypothetical protein